MVGRVMWSNCLFYAMWMWIKHGGYLMARWSMWGCFPHFLHMSRSGVITHLKPLRPRRRIFPPLIFKGKVMEGDYGYLLA